MPVPPADHLMPLVICDPYSGNVTCEFPGIENAFAMVTGLPCPSVMVTVCADPLVLVMMTAITHDVVAVSAVVLVGTACHAGVNAVVPQAVFGIVCTWPITLPPVGSEPVTLKPVLAMDPLMGKLPPVPSTLSALIEAAPCTVITSAEGVPAVPRAGCLAAVEAPVGSDTVPETFVRFHVPPWFAVTVLPGPPDCCNCAYIGPRIPAAASSRNSVAVMYTWVECLVIWFSLGSRRSTTGVSRGRPRHPFVPSFRATRGTPPPRPPDVPLPPPASRCAPRGRSLRHWRCESRWALPSASAG